MATCVSCSPHTLSSLSSATTCPTFTSSSRRLPVISCSSKRKKKASAKSKAPLPANSFKLDPLQNEDFLLGVAGGASTLTALQPLLDEEDTLPRQKQKLELQLAHVQKPRSNTSAQQNVDPLLRFTLASYEPINTEPVLQGCDAQAGLVDDYDEKASSRDNHHPLKPNVAARDLGEEEEEVEEEDDGDFDWVEINAEDENDNVEDEDEDDDYEQQQYVYWEGDLPPMTKEEEAKVLHRARKDLARMEREKRASTKEIMSYATLIGDLEDEEDEDDEEEEYEEYAVKDYSSDGNEINEEADAALAQFEASARKTTIPKSSRTALIKDETSYSATKKKLLMGHMQSEIDMEDPWVKQEDEITLAASITKEAKAENRRKNPLHCEEGERKEPKRSIPAVMRSFDKAKIFVKAGNGGNGVVAFRREKYVPFGGPSGGSGGRGGNIYVKADPSMNSLLSFRRSIHFRAGRGSHGMGKSQDGAAGEDCTINVPLGTVIREAGDGISGPGKILCEVTRHNQCELLLLGGRGGRGNAAFKTGRNKAPQLAENGEEGTEMWLQLELKLVADVGIIGVPNAGKSTLLSVISAAQPEIAAYPFTTLLPNLGVVPVGFDSTMVVADLPGLLEGAHLGIGLGHEFLRHTERCRVLVHIVDGTSQQPEQEYEAVRLELQLFNPALSEKPSIVAFNKMDIPEAADHWPNFQAYLKQKGVESICMSAATKTGVIDVVNKAYSLLQSLPSSPNEIDSDEESQGADEMTIGEIIRRQHSAPIEEFEIIQDKVSNIWRVEGVGLERFVQMTNWEYFEALTRFQHVMTVSGVNRALKEQGVVEGDTVIVGEMDFEWHDSEDIRATDWKRGFRGSRIWPH